MKKIIISSIYSIIYIIILISIYILHIKYLKVSVILYSAILDGLLATIIMAIVISKKSKLLNYFEKIQLVIIWMLLSYVMAISIPTVIDRSLSFYLLEKIHQRGGGIKLENFENIFTKEYVKEHRLLDVRLTEQKQSGTIKIENGCVKITEFGKILVVFSQYFRSNLLPRQRLLNDQYTDDLINPFKNSLDINYYKCE